jgi:nitrogen fixation protein NifB
MDPKLSRHPCFDASARHSHARVHLPVAAGCNVQCNFCDRKGDCLNESRPGITSALLKPEQALAYVDRIVSLEKRLSVVGIAGPGDPFANGPVTIRTLELVQERYPELLLCVASNGVGLAPFADDLARVKVSHVTLTINAIDPQTVEKIYAWVRIDQRMYRGREAAEALIERQALSLKRLVERGITVKINTIVMPGINDDQIVDVAAAVSKAGASVLNLMPLYPVATTPFAELPPPSAELMASLRSQAEKYLPQMSHCTRCRADAVGLIGDAMTPEKIQLLQLSARPANSNRTYLAVASREGVMVNQHLGEARSLWIYSLTDGIPNVVERRVAPPAGGGADRWEALARLLSDCVAVVTSGVGPAPTRVLEAHGVGVKVADCLVEEAVVEMLSGRPLRAPLRAFRCGDGCGGKATGCG